MLSLNCSPQRDQTDIAPFIFFDPLHEFNIEIHWDLQIILLSKFISILTLDGQIRSLKLSFFIGQSSI